MEDLRAENELLTSDVEQVMARISETDLPPDLSSQVSGLESEMRSLATLLVTVLDTADDFKDRADDLNGRVDDLADCVNEYMDTIGDWSTNVNAYYRYYYCG